MTTRDIPIKYPFDRLSAPGGKALMDSLIQGDQKVLHIVRMPARSAIEDVVAKQDLKEMQRYMTKLEAQHKGDQDMDGMRTIRVCKKHIDKEVIGELKDAVYLGSTQPQTAYDTGKSSSVDAAGYKVTEGDIAEMVVHFTSDDVTVYTEEWFSSGGKQAAKVLVETGYTCAKMPHTKLKPTRKNKKDSFTQIKLVLVTRKIKGKRYSQVWYVPSDKELARTEAIATARRTIAWSKERIQSSKDAIERMNNQIALEETKIRQAECVLFSPVKIKTAACVTRDNKKWKITGVNLDGEDFDDIVDITGYEDIYTYANLFWGKYLVKNLAGDFDIVEAIVEEPEE